MATREAYVPPSTSTGNAINMQPNADTLANYSVKTQYICGECAEKVVIGRGDLVRCNACGHRIMYKERTKRMVQFEAR